MKNRIIPTLLTVFAFSLVNADKPIVLKTQGSFFVGGKVLKTDGKYDPNRWSDPKGQSRHGDHAYVFYQIPDKAFKYPVVFLHGASQSGKTWETTPDGRDGFQNIFLRYGYSVYIVDRPRCGRAGQSLSEGSIKNVTVDQLCYDIFRIGVWPNYYKGVKFPTDQRSLDQFFRQSTPNIGTYDKQLVADTMSQLFDKIGDGILVTHSQSAEAGWLTAIKNKKVKAIIAIEPSNGFFFPKEECPCTVRSSSGLTRTFVISKKDFLELTKIPILVLFGDNIPNGPTENKGKDNWYQRLKMSRQWAKLLNKNGGKVRVLHLPEIGIRGNTHFISMDKNNKEVAKLIFNFLKENGFEKTVTPKVRDSNPKIQPRLSKKKNKEKNKQG